MTENPQKKPNNDHEEELQDLFQSLGAPNQKATDTIIGEKNRTIKPGNSIILKSRIISGNYNRVAILFEFLENLGLDVEKERSAIFGATIGFSPELAPYGMRGEVADLVRPREPKKEPVANPSIPESKPMNNQVEQTQT